MNRIVNPFKKTLTITIEIDEEQGSSQVKASKPVNPAVLFEAILTAARGAFQSTIQEYDKRLTAAKAETTLNQQKSKGNGWGSNHGGN